MTGSDETHPMPVPPEPAPDPVAPSPGRRRLVLGAGVAAAAAALLVGTFFLGRSSGSTTAAGPATLGAALTAARDGSLPCGTSTLVTRRMLDRLCQGQAGGAGTSGGSRSGGTGAGGAGGTAARALMVGTVSAVSGNQVTVQTRQGSLTLNVGSDAAVRTVTSGSTADLAAGSRVLITGGGGAAASTRMRQLVVLGPGTQGGTAPTTTPPVS